MATRFTDDLFHNTDGSDFIVRKRLPLATQIFVIFAIAFEVIYITGCIMTSTGSTRLFITTLILTLGTLTWFTIYTSARLRDLVLATEFQNAMLASAAQLSTRFCFITKRDGSIVYVDQGFQKVFPQFLQSNDRNVDGLFDGAGVPREMISKIILMLQHGESNRILLQLTNPEGGTHLPIMLSVDLLPRPKGYFLMRGRDYVEKRGDSARPMDMAADMGLELSLSLMPDGIVTANTGGAITYANRVLEEWLGFAPGELRGRPFKLNQIIYQYAGFDAGKPVHANFDGDVILQRKDRSLVTMNIRQIAIGRPAAISAIIRAGDAPKKV